MDLTSAAAALWFLNNFFKGPLGGGNITMQWCGVPEVLMMPPVSSTFTIFEEKQNYSVKFIPGTITCPLDVASSELTMNISRPIRTKRPFHESEFSASGYFRAGDHYYPHEGFCITNWTSETVTVRVCGNYEESYDEGVSLQWSFPECGIDNPCLPKCCPMNKLWTLSTDIENHTKPCQDRFDNSKAFSPTVYDMTSKKPSKKRPIHYFRNRLPCGTFFVHEGHNVHGIYEALQSCFRFREDGKLLIRSEYFIWVEVPVENYCMDGVQMNGSLGNLQNEEFLGEEKHFGIYMCEPTQKHEWESPYYSIVYGTALIFSSVFLLLTFLVYGVLWKEQKIQGWITMSHSATMFLMYCSLAANHFLDVLVGFGLETERSSSCIFSGIITHYFFLSNFCWLTVICFSLFWTFRCINVSNPRATHIGQYILYATFGWGLPFVFVLMSVIMDLKYSYEPCNMVVVPEYGLNTCTLSVGAAGPYMYYPVAFLLTLNLIFFSVTSYKLYEYNRSTTMARENLNKTKQLFQLITKLFFVMGFTWILEFVSWFQSGPGVEKTWYWAIIDIVNILQGVAIFSIYVCKKKVVRSLRNSINSRKSSRTSHKSGRSFGTSRETDTFSTSTSGSEHRKNVELKSMRRNQEQ
ncbi:unnamed protein product [Allacma fusca]|uniref:G-protein coupled receptors family 2 profile 2 domain-containing protein n=1 Tax=Allacma fusca TaxID=39272 RepID=A0A8J2NND9_9HEXA|nr:unnamed protein product [Allacma fusca]